MLKSLKLALLLGILALLTGACAWITEFTVEQNQMTSESGQAFTIDSEVSVSGTVTGTIDDCAFDGICALVLDVDGATVNAIWAEGMMGCEGQFEDGIAVGTSVDAFGIARDANSLSICPSPDYYIRHAE